MSRRASSLLVPLLLAGFQAALAQQAPQSSPPGGEPARQQGQAGQPVAQQPPNAPAPDPRSVDVRELIDRVAASTGKTFLVDPRVRASVFVAPPMEQPSYEVLLSILRMHGHAAVEIEGRVNVFPDALVRSMPLRFVQRDDDRIPDDEWVTRIIDVPNAASLVPVLRPLMSQAGHLSAVVTEGDERGSGKLILVETYANIRRMTELIETLRR